MIKHNKALQNLILFFRYILAPLIIEVPITIGMYESLTQSSIYNHAGVLIGYSILLPLLWIILNGLLILPPCPKNKKGFIKSNMHTLSAVLILGIIGLFVLFYGIQTNPAGKKDFIYMSIPLVQSIGFGILILGVLISIQMLILTIASFIKYYLYPTLVKMIEG